MHIVLKRESEVVFLKHHYIKMLSMYARVCARVTEVGVWERDWTGDVRPSYLLSFVLRVHNHKRMQLQSSS